MSDQKMKTLAPTLLALTLCAGVAYASENEIRAQCASSGPEHTLACLQIRAKASEAHMQRQEDWLARRIDHWSASPKLREQARMAHTVSTAIFVHYREAQCDFSAVLYSSPDDSDSEIKRLACLIDQNQHRTKLLIEKAKALPD